MELKYSAPKGTNDSTYPESEKVRQLILLACGLFELNGYRLITTPVLESTDLFIRSIGRDSDIVSKEMYTFEDQGGDFLTMRPEGTAPVIRAYLERSLSSRGLPQKLYYYGPMFRRERPQAGRYRQFNQIGAELIGSKDPVADAEIISISSTLFRELKLERFKLNINSVGCRECRKEYLAALTGELDKISGDLCDQCRKRLVQNPMRVFDCKEERCIKALGSVSGISGYLCQSCSGHFQSVLSNLDVMGIEYVRNDRLVRGLDYYTGTAFEFQFEGLGAQNTVSAGGRYDYLVEELGGTPTGGVGFSLGIERLLLAIEAEKAEPFAVRGVTAFVASVDVEGSEILKALQKVREAGISADTDFLDRSLKAQMKHANRLGARFVVIVGGEEHKGGQVVLRDLEASEQWTVGIDEAVSMIQRIIKESK